MMQKDKRWMWKSGSLRKSIWIAIGILVVNAVIAFMLFSEKDSDVETQGEEYSTEGFIQIEEKDIVDGIHVPTGLKNAEGLKAVVNNCTNCHSAKLVMQNRMTAERWAATIDWMQESQNLWDLGENEQVIIDYLVTNYPPERKGRRASLKDIEWYELED